MNKHTVDTPFEFVLLRAPALEGRRPDSSSFQEHFTKDDESVTVFKSLGGDATLVVPKLIG